MCLVNSWTDLIFLWLYIIFCIPAIILGFIQDFLSIQTISIDGAWKFSTLFYIVIGLSIYFF